MFEEKQTRMSSSLLPIKNNFLKGIGFQEVLEVRRGDHLWHFLKSTVIYLLPPCPVHMSPAPPYSQTTLHSTPTTPLKISNKTVFPLSLFFLNPWSVSCHWSPPLLSLAAFLCLYLWVIALILLPDRSLRHQPSVILLSLTFSRDKQL